jgi:uncharacterized membrane protein
MTALRGVTIIFLALAAALCAIVHWRYAIFRNDVDLGIFTQVIAGIGHGFSSTAEGGVNHLAVHWSPIIIVAWPFVRAFGPIGLEYLQAILVAAVVFPIWGLARARFCRAFSFAITGVAAIYPILWANGVGDFHEMAFVPVLSATLVYALDRRRWTLAVGATLLLACTREDQFVILGVNGLIFALIARGDRQALRTGIAIALPAAVLAIVYFIFVRPALAAHVPYAAVQFYDWSGAPGAHAGTAAALLLARLRYVAIILAPLAFLPFFSRYGLFLIPGLAEILASHEPVTLAPGAHYSGLLTGYALAAFIDGAARIGAHRRALAGALVATAAAISVAISIFASPMEYWYYLYRRPSAHDALLEQTLRRFAPDADVGAEDEIFAHLGLDPNASIGFNGQRWFVYDRAHYSLHWHDVDQPAVRAALARHAYRVTSERDGVVVLERASN